MDPTHTYASASVAAWGKLDQGRFSLKSSLEIDAEEMVALKKAYLDHLTSAIVNETEREEWSFMFKDD